MRPIWLQRVVWLIVVPAFAAVAVGTLRSGDPAVATMPTSSQKSALLVTAVHVPPGAGAAFSGAGARQAAERALADIPIPAAADFSHLQWEAMGTITEGDIQLMLQMNAACSWYRRVLDGDNSDLTLAIIRDIPRWSAFASNDVGAATQTLLDAQRTGDLTPIRDFVRANCGGAALTARPTGRP